MGEWAFDIRRGFLLDPTGCKGSLIQFCACPGPSEAAAINPTSISTGESAKGFASMGTTFGSWVFITREPLPRGWQLTMQYGTSSKQCDEFFEERGIKRLN